MYGQSVIVTARWILVVSAFILALWNPGPMGELRIQVLFILLLAVANFYLQAQILMKKPASSSVVYFASAADLAVISIMIILGGGFESNIYVFYFPALLALSVAFSPGATLLFAGGAASFYAFISLGALWRYRFSGDDRETNHDVSHRGMWPDLLANRARPPRRGSYGAQAVDRTTPRSKSRRRLSRKGE
jgi:hypothetical protein